MELHHQGPLCLMAQEVAKNGNVYRGRQVHLSTTSATYGQRSHLAVGGLSSPQEAQDEEEDGLQEEDVQEDEDEQQRHHGDRSGTAAACGCHGYFGHRKSYSLPPRWRSAARAAGLNDNELRACNGINGPALLPTFSSTSSGSSSCSSSTDGGGGGTNTAPFLGGQILRVDDFRPVASPCKNVNPNEFRRRQHVVTQWFDEFDDEQKNLLLKELLKRCKTPQNHYLSVAMAPRLHQCCPPNCCDLLSWLPTPASQYILSFLDPVSLCRCLQVCRAWQSLASNEGLWQKFCASTSYWQLSPSAERKQLSLYRNKDGSVQWKTAFSERFRLSRNWMRGHCHVRTFEGHAQGISCVQFDDTRIVSGSSDKTIKVWNIRTNSQWSVMTLVGHSATVRCLHLDGNRLVSGSMDCTIKVWDLSSHSGWSSIACKVTMIGHDDTVRCLQADDEKVVSGSYDRSLKVWDMRTGQCRLTLTGHEGAVLCVQHDQNKILSGSADKTIKIWNFIPGTCINTLHGHQDSVTCLQFDASRIISGSLDRTIKFWNLATGQCLSTLDWMKSEGHTGVIRCLQADRWRIVSAGDDKTLKVWSLETGQRLVTLKNHTDGVTCLQFNDFVIVSGSYDKTVKLWDFSVC